MGSHGKGAQTNSHMLVSDHLSNSINYFQRQSTSVLDGSAILIMALVDVIVQELVQEEAVSRENLGQRKLVTWRFGDPLHQSNVIGIDYI